MTFSKWFYTMVLLLLPGQQAYCWGFFAHRQINYQAVFLLPPPMLALYKKHIVYLQEHAVDPDKRRYVIADEGARHFIDLDHYGNYPFDSLPRFRKDAEAKFSADSLQEHGIVPWWIQTMLYRLTNAFKAKDQARILQYSAEIGHYIADAHVPLHTSSNYNGQKTNQHGIHGFWESRIPELLALKEWDFFIGKAQYIDQPLTYTWQFVLESAAAADSVLSIERKLNQQFPADRKYAFEDRNGVTIRQYSTAYTLAYNKLLHNMVERRMQQSIFHVASFWYTAWVNAGQPDLQALSHEQWSDPELKAFDSLNLRWKNGTIKGKSCQ